jgi:hypothetical protein
MDMEITEVPLNDIQPDERAQPRLEMDQDVINEYAQAMRSGRVFPPVEVFKDPEGMVLADGYHRLEAAKRAGLSVLPATVHEGDRRAAILFSVGANATHGIRRSNADKRRAVLTMLEDPEWRQWSDSEIADQCGVSRPLVAEMRAGLEAKKAHPAELQDNARTVKRGSKVYSMDLTKIRGQRVRGQEPPKVSPPDAKPDSLPAIDFLLELPKNSLFKVHPSEIVPLIHQRGKALVLNRRINLKAGS